jgi:hypothetical protein
MNRRRLLIALSCVATAPGLSPAAGADEAVLTVTRPDGAAAALSLADLDALPQREIRTATPWTEGVRRWSGPAMLDVLRAHGLDGATAVQATALNDYAVRMPVAELVAHAPIIATRSDGAELSRREKGPLFVVFDFDRFDERTLKVVANLAVWQLATLAPAP